jgi:hypothetical protein
LQAANGLVRGAARHLDAADNKRSMKMLQALTGNGAGVADDCMLVIRLRAAPCSEQTSSRNDPGAAVDAVGVLSKYRWLGCEQTPHELTYAAHGTFSRCRGLRVLVRDHCTVQSR